MIPEHKMIAQDRGPEEAARWYRANCNADVCSRRAADADAGCKLLGHYRHVDFLVQEFPALATELFRRWAPAELRRLAMIRRADRMPAREEQHDGE